MTGKEFKKARLTCLKVSQEELGILMDGTPKRTIQDIEALGDKEIRGVYSACMRLLLERDKWVMAEITSKIGRLVDERFPNGIPSC